MASAPSYRVVRAGERCAPKSKYALKSLGALKTHTYGITVILPPLNLYSPSYCFSFSHPQYIVSDGS